ncbi:LysR family transcriptional regulator [Leeia sp. TBRC 13508]|uniref:LysR family transcriptional regulator n=1 Tax=Leeia speluncae TaxID=2884804 RepID=A0ABS8D1J9_9NEIS|nr:LysR family transcriptional regulator [Leeia speluncae]MCB6182070.1 LysR family transcriptional regulator [Leeia speluncae]
MTISIDDLTLLQEVASAGSFSKAAAKLGCSQPQISVRIGLLETYFGAVLFERHRRGVKATPACMMLLPHVTKALAQINDGKLAVQGAPTTPRITIGSLPSLAHTMFSPLLAALADAPIEIACTTGDTSELLKELLDDTVQVGFVLDAPAVAGLQLEMLWKSPIICVVAASHPLANSKNLKLADIVGYRLAPQDWDDECDTLIASIYRLRTVAMPLHKVAPASAARALVMEQGFVSFMPEITVIRELNAGTLVRLNVTDLPKWYWEIMMAYRPGKLQSPAKAMLLEAARTLARTLRPANSHAN